MARKRTTRKRATVFAELLGLAVTTALVWWLVGALTAISPSMCGFIAGTIFGAFVGSRLKRAAVRLARKCGVHVSFRSTR